MKTTLILVGKTVSKHIAACVDDYVERLGHYMPFELITIPDLKNNRNLSEEQQKEREGEQILKQVQAQDYLVLLDEHGKEMRSIDFATWIQKKQQTVNAINGISCEFEAGKVYALMGRSGSGKTTLLSLMAGLDVPTSGRIVCDGVPTDEADLEQFRREKVAVIYQDFRLFPLLTAAENVMYPMELRGMAPAEAKRRAAELIESVGLPDSVLDRFPAMLSGGEQQRVAIARALGMETKALLADEPTGNLDEDNSAKIFEILQSLAHKDGYCVVIVTHDEAIGEKADVAVRIRDGVIAEQSD